MQLLLFADGAVGHAIFSWLASNWRRDIGLVVTTYNNEIARGAHKHNIPTIVFESEDQIVEVLRSDNRTFDLGLLAWWPKIVGATLLDLPTAGFINTHPSLLPYNRGKHYNFWALVEQSPFGVTLHRVDTGVDSGEVVAQRPISYGWEDTGKSLFEKASAAMIELVKSAYPTLRTLQFQSTPQSPGAGSFHRAAELDAASQIFLDEEYTARSLLNLLRARTFAPYPGCWFREGNDVYEIQISIEKRKN